MCDCDRSRCIYLGGVEFQMIDITRLAPISRFCVRHLTMFMMLDFALIGYEVGLLSQINFWGLVDQLAGKHIAF